MWNVWKIRVAGTKLWKNSFVTSEYTNIKVSVLGLTILIIWKVCMEN